MGLPCLMDTTDYALSALRWSLADIPAKIKSDSPSPARHRIDSISNSPPRFQPEPSIDGDSVAPQGRFPSLSSPNTAAAGKRRLGNTAVSRDNFAFTGLDGPDPPDSW
jgi:hypothetical protein